MNIYTPQQLIDSIEDINDEIELLQRAVESRDNVIEFLRAELESISDYLDSLEVPNTSSKGGLRTVSRISILSKRYKNNH